MITVFLDFVCPYRPISCVCGRLLRAFRSHVIFPLKYTFFVYRYPAGWELGARAALLPEGKGGSAAHGRREEIKG